MARVVEVVLREHLTAEQLRKALGGVAIERGGARTAMLVDALAMTGYDGDARAAFVEWNSRHRERIAGVAILTHKTLWVMVISAMSLASKQQMKAFRTRDEALAWCEQL